VFSLPHPATAEQRIRPDHLHSEFDTPFIGRFVDVTCTLTQVSVSCQGQPAGRHERCWASGRTVTDPEHVAVAKGLRSAYAAPRPTVIVDDLQRDLADYDAAFGVHLDTPVSA